MVELVRAFRAGDVDARAASSTSGCCRSSTRSSCETNPIPVKAALALRGADRPEELRLPLTPLSPPNRERLQVALKELGLLG